MELKLKLLKNFLRLQIWNELELSLVMWDCIGGSSKMFQRLWNLFFVCFKKIVHFFMKLVVKLLMLLKKSLFWPLLRWLRIRVNYLRSCAMQVITPLMWFLGKGRIILSKLFTTQVRFKMKLNWIKLLSKKKCL